MKFGNSVADIFIIKHTPFCYDAFGFAISVVHFLGLQFFRGHSVQYGLCIRLLFPWQPVVKLQYFLSYINHVICYILL